MNKKNKDILAKEEPFVLESSDSDPEFPALDEFEVDKGGWKGSTKPHPGRIWALIAIIAVAILIAVFVFSGEWMTPTQAQKEAQVQFNEQTTAQDLGEN